MYRLVIASQPRNYIKPEQYINAVSYPTQAEAKSEGIQYDIAGCHYLIVSEADAEIVDWSPDFDGYIKKRGTEFWKWQKL